MGANQRRAIHMTGPDRLSLACQASGQWVQPSPQIGEEPCRFFVNLRGLEWRFSSASLHLLELERRFSNGLRMKLAPTLSLPRFAALRKGGDLLLTVL